MKVVRAEWAGYRLPFVAPMATAHGTFRVREGILLQLTLEDGGVGLGEAAPVPWFGGGTLDENAAFLAERAGTLVGLGLDEADRRVSVWLGEPDPCVSAALCALDTAVCDLQARRANLPLAAWLARLDGSEGDVQGTLAVNATVGATETGAAVRAARAAVAAGFSTVKLKVGVMGSRGSGASGVALAEGILSAELGRIVAVRAAIGPEVALRLDANGAWTADEAIYLLRTAERVGLDVELIEQPVATDDLAGLARVSAAVRAVVAADEAASTPVSAQRVVEAGAARALVVKPMMAGGPRSGRRIVHMARAAGLDAVVTTTIDCGVGVAAALHLAASVGPQRLASGLATASLLVSDLLEQPLHVERGVMRLPEGPGLGVAVAADLLSQYGHTWQDVPLMGR